MLSVVASIFSLLVGISLLLVAASLHSTLLAVHAGLEGFSASVTGVIMPAYFFGFILGTFICPRFIRRVGHIRVFAAMAAWGARSLLVYFAVKFLSVAKS